MSSNALTYRPHALSSGITAMVMLCAVFAFTAAWDLPIVAADEVSPAVASCGEPQTKPESIVLICDNTWAVDKIIWTNWSTSGAKGTGIEFRNNCVPNCAQGSAFYSPVTITLNGAIPPSFRYSTAVITNQNTGKSDTWPLR